MSAIIRNHNHENDKCKMTETENVSPIVHLTEHISPIVPTDPMAEAGRKVLLTEFIKMLEVEAGSRTGEDIEDVHKMRVSIRRMRSAFRLLEAYYKPKAVKPFVDELRQVMQVLGAIRDLDVMIHNLEDFQSTLDTSQVEVMKEVIDSLDLRRADARKELNHILDRKSYRRFVKSFCKFLTTPEMGAKSIDPKNPVPYQLRHILAPMIYEHLSAARAYDSVLATADAETLHALRIEFKRLRYIVSLFGDVLGSQIQDFVEELKIVQDHLGHLNDIDVAHTSLNELMEDLEGDQITVLWGYINHLEAEKPELLAKMPEIWKRFNAKNTQRKLAAAIASL
jgi:CHAD domain-containing protein